MISSHLAVKVCDAEAPQLPRDIRPTRRVDHLGESQLTEPGQFPPDPLGVATSVWKSMCSSSGRSRSARWVTRPHRSVSGVHSRGQAAQAPLAIASRREGSRPPLRLSWRTCGANWPPPSTDRLAPWVSPRPARVEHRAGDLRRGGERGVDGPGPDEDVGNLPGKFGTVSQLFGQHDEARAVGARR